jgi:hypothetical protein
VEEELDGVLPRVPQHFPRLAGEPKLEVPQVPLQEDVRAGADGRTAGRARDAGDDGSQVRHGMGSLVPAAVTLQVDHEALHAFS